MKESALIAVDFLYDFIDGSLACQNAVNAVDNAVRFIEKACSQQDSDENEIMGNYPVLFVCDHHPGDHCSFKDFGGIWPAHCVQGTRGGDIHTKLQPFASEELTFYKGCDRSMEQYSSFEGRNGAGQSLGEVLELLDIQEVYVCGIATEYCVRNTCEDLLKAGFKVHLLQDCLGYVEPGGHRQAISDMAAAGIIIE